MKDLYKNYLFDKHILVAESGLKTASEITTAETASSEESAFEALFAIGSLFNIRIIKGQKLAQSSMIPFISGRLGEDVPEPFYKGFPATVRELTKEQLLFDQLMHYVRTYGLGDFSQPGHSLFEEQFERAAFAESASKPLEFSIITQEEAVAMIGEIVSNLLAGTRPLSDFQYLLVKSFLTDHDFMPECIASKNTCIRLLIDTRNLSLADFLSLSDVIKAVDELNYREYKNINIRKLNLKNQDRKFVQKLIDRLIASGRCDVRNCYEKKQLWCGLLHHIHYTSKTPEGKTFADAMRSDGNESVYAQFEKAMAQKNIRAAVEALEKGKGSAAILRNLNYIISRCETVEDMAFVADCIDTKNVIVLLQLLIRYAQHRSEAAPRTFTFSKYNRLVTHRETEEEQQKRRSVISEGQAKMLSEKLRANLKNLLSGRLGKVYIDPDMVNYALPIQENTAQGGFGVLTRGSRLRMPEAKKLRAFTYWEKTNDIDLSVFGIDKNGKRTEFSWRTMAGKQSAAITYSGDETSGYNGGSEYFDIDLDAFKEQYQDIRYMIFCDNVFSLDPFCECFCKAGYMIRDVEDSGQVYEPKTVKSSFLVNCDSTFAFLFGLDLQTNDFIWLNMARSIFARVAGETELNFVTEYFHVTDVINVASFFELMAKERVTDPAAAEVIVTDKDIDCPEGAQLIREYDIEKMIALMNA